MGGEKSHTFAIFSGNELVSGIVLNQNYKLNSFDTDFYINSYHSRETFILVGLRTGQVMKIFKVKLFATHVVWTANNLEFRNIILINPYILYHYRQH